MGKGITREERDPRAVIKTEHNPAVEGSGAGPGHAFRLEWNRWNPEENYREGVLGALHNLQDLNPDQGLKPES